MYVCMYIRVYVWTFFIRSLQQGHELVDHGVVSLLCSTKDARNTTYIHTYIHTCYLLQKDKIQQEVSYLSYASTLIQFL